MAAGLLFLAVLVAEATGGLLQQYSNDLGHWVALFLTGVINQLISVLVVVVWFSLVFKFLADGRPEWKIAIAGGIFTGLLFTAGKLLVRWLLLRSNMQTIYGNASSFVLLLLFVFYASFMFYYGACFTKSWADFKRKPIEPTKHAIRYRLERVKMDEATKSDKK